MKNYYFNTKIREYKVTASNLNEALARLVEILIENNDGSRVLPYYYSSNAKKISRAVYKEYFSDLSY